MDIHHLGALKKKLIYLTKDVGITFTFINVVNLVISG